MPDTPTTAWRQKFCCEHAWLQARQAAWKAVQSSPCACDAHIEYCATCFPPEFRPGGGWDQCKPAASPAPQELPPVQLPPRPAPVGRCAVLIGSSGYIWRSSRLLQRESDVQGCVEGWKPERHGLEVKALKLFTEEHLEAYALAAIAADRRAGGR